MCVYSMVMDDYARRFEPFEIPVMPNPNSLSPSPAPLSFVLLPASQIEELKALIAEFKEAVAAAKTVDRLTRQPDCPDPEKAKLEQRVAELEKQLEAVRTAAAQP